MQDGWEKFWNFIGIAFWVVLFGWLGISAITPDDPKPALNTSTYKATNTPSSTYNSYNSDSYMDDESTSPSLYRSTYNSSYDRDCSDFDSWEDAQYYYENIADDNLDRDNDGIACESLN